MTTPTNVEELNDAMQDGERRKQRLILGRGPVLAAMLGMAAVAGAGGGGVGIQRDGTGASREDREKRNAEKLSRREFKTARAEAKRQRKAARRLAAKSAVPERVSPASL